MPPSINATTKSAAEKAADLLINEARAIDVTYAKYFASSIAGIILFYTIMHWTQIFLHRSLTRNVVVRLMWQACRRTRRIRSGFIIGHRVITPNDIMLPLAYFGINLAWMFTDIDISLGTTFAKRCGWLALCNLCLVIFLGLKNTPLSPLAGRSYQALNILHRCCGHTTIVLIMLHALNAIADLAKEHLLTYLVEPGQYAGVVAAAALLILGLSTIASFRKYYYEAFYALHIVAATIILAATLVHVQKIGWSAIAIVIAAAAFWASDRLIRLVRWVHHSSSNSCTITALPEGATKVVMRRSIKARPGAHAFLWVPGIGKFQSHPFTLVSNNPVEFVVTRRNGFTRALHDAAVQNPGRSLRAGVEGAYGQIPTLKVFDKLVLIAGGSGITFAMALAMDWLREREQIDNESKLHLVWSFKCKVWLRWFPNKLRALQASPQVKLHLHVTGTNTAIPMDGLPVSSSCTNNDPEKPSMPPVDDLPPSALLGLASNVARGRPELTSILDDAVGGLSRDSKALVAACGPESLMSSARTAVRSHEARDGPSIQLHLENFG